MMMGSGSTTTMSMPMTSSTAGSSSMSMSMSMSMSSSTSSGSMDMAMGSSTASSSTSTSTMDMSDSSMDMSMNMYLKADYTGYPVVFKTLKASSGGKAFGIFVILFFVAFFFRGLSFLSAYIEQRIFQNYSYYCESGESRNTPQGKLDSKSSTDIESTEHAGEHGCCEPPSQTPEIAGSNNPVNDQRSPLAKFFHFTPVSIYRDFIRLCLTFVSTMIGYALMLAVMTFILPYFFAVILGISFGEIFFMRLSIAFGIHPPESVCSSLH